MDESEITSYSLPAEKDYNTSDIYDNTFDKSSEGYNRTDYDNKDSKSDQNHDQDDWKDQSLLRIDSADDLNLISPAVDTTDSGIGSDNYFIASLRDPDKPSENGITPLLCDDRTNLPTDQVPPPQDTGCGVDCMYYTMLCCECSIL